MSRPGRLLNVDLGPRGYPIRIGAGLLAERGPYREIASRPLRLVTDATVAGLHLAPVQAALGLSAADVYRLPPGEQTKTWASAERILDWLLESRLPRDGVVVALGGGVIGDLAGFAAAIYQRGVDFIQLPTTLLAQVDSSVGGKTGVNHARGKNLIGAFHQPRLVLCDTATLSTLPQRELLAGVAEVIKYGMLGDAQFFQWLEHNLDGLLALEAARLDEAVERCCAMKARIVAQDEFETVADGAGPRAVLNLGHTFGHAVETFTGYASWLHGEAVALGLCMAADLSARLNWLRPAEAQRCIELIRRAGLPVKPPAGMKPADFRKLMRRDKKVRGGRLRLVLMHGIGDAAVTEDFDAVKFEETLETFSA